MKSTPKKAFDELIVCPHKSQKSESTEINEHFFPLTEIARVGESKRIYQIEYVAEEQLLVVICGKQHHVRLVPVRALDGDDVEWLKVADTKACVSFTTGLLRQAHGTQAAVYCLCVAVKRQVPSTIIVYQRLYSDE